MKRILVRGSLLLAVMALATTAIVVAPANAATVSQTCSKLTGSVTIKPGINTTPRPQTATAKGNASGCSPAAKTGGSGVLTATLKLPSNSSCTGLATGNQTLKLTAKVTWKNKQTSSLALTAKTGTGSNVLVATLTGKVSAGLFATKAVTGQIKVKPGAGQDCVNHPVTTLTFTNTKPFVIH
jgi:hypothetical protein